ncbi:MAG TPA: serine/threonine-protein kinase [Kofleriaceae bacterium]|nr:serine/threonine-protein kinase [Kofleriaceae bacterium]
MNCPSCQSPLPPAARFCGVCGHQITTPAAAARPNPTPPPGAPGGRAAPRPPGANRGRTKDGQDPYVGTVLNNRFKIESKLGEGGFGAVYKGLQQGTGRKVALKLLHPEMTRDENLVARFRREGLVLCNLRDPHTITTYDFDQTADGTLYIAMELLEGKSLHQVFHSEAPIDWRRVLKIVGQMCSSLGEAHKQGIVHRDLKPENIYLENRGGDPEFVKILDFGIAKVMKGDNTVDPGAPQLTATGQTLGTLEYMSPEQLMGKQLDGRSDVYALGVLGYELLTGRLPFPDAKGPAALITAQLKQTPKPPSQANPAGNIPAGVDRIILKTLEKNKDHRFPDVGALAAATQECIASGGVWGTDAAAPAAAAGKGGRAALAETTRGDPMNLGAPPAVPPGGAPPMGAAHARPMTPQPIGGPGSMGPGPMQGNPRDQSSPNLMAGMQMPGMAAHAPVGAPAQPYGGHGGPGPMGGPSGMMPGSSYPPGASHGHGQHMAPPRKSPLMWIIIGVLLVAAATGAVLALTL